MECCFDYYRLQFTVIGLPFTWHCWPRVHGILNYSSLRYSIGTMSEWSAGTFMEIAKDNKSIVRQGIYAQLHV